MVAQPVPPADAEDTPLLDSAGGAPPAPRDSAMPGAQMSPEIYDALLSSLGSSMAGTVDSGTSGGGPTGPTTTATPATPATTATHHSPPPKPTAKQRAQSAPKRPRAGGVSETNTAPARPPATTSFFVHRRATPGPLAVEHQLEADREAMDALAKGMVALEKVSAAQQAQIETLTRANGQINRNAIGLEKAVLDRVEAAKLFAAKDTEDKISDLRERLRVEFSDGEKLSKHLVGHDTPVLKPLVDTLMKAQMDAVNHQFAVLDQFVKERVMRDNMVQQYLTNVAAEKPVDGEKINNAFYGVAVELIEIRAAALNGLNGAAQASRPQVSSV